MLSGFKMRIVGQYALKIYRSAEKSTACPKVVAFGFTENYTPEFDSGILKDAEISASLTIL